MVYVRGATGWRIVRPARRRDKMGIEGAGIHQRGADADVVSISDERASTSADLPRSVGANWPQDPSRASPRLDVLWPGLLEIYHA